jgi:kumamolisin
MSTSAIVPEGLPTDPDLVELTLVLRPRTDTQALIAAELEQLLVLTHAPYEHTRLAELRGAHPDDVAAVRAWAEGAGLRLGELRPERRLLRVAGPPERIEAELAAPGPRSVEAGVRIPDAISGQVVAVLGLDRRPFARTHFRRLPLPDPTVPLATAAPLSYEPPAVAGAYQFPSGSGAVLPCIGLVELGGGFNAADLSTYFGQLGLPVPKVVPVSVDGGENQPTGNPDGPDGEVGLDIEVVGSIAPGAPVAVYFAPNTDQGFLEAITTAVHDQSNHPAVISISWGGPEANWPAATMTAFDQAFQDAALVGITILAAAGDGGSSDGLLDPVANVDFPASSPHVLGCGGTRLLTTAGKITSETVWNDGTEGGATGGGVSAFFPLPSWQSAAGVPASVDPGAIRGRGVPDVAGDADPETGYRVLIDGQAAVYGGTSAVAPLWAALIVVCGATLGHQVGYLNPQLYQSLAGAGACHDITEGDNGAYSARVGWDPCTGWGSPDGARLLAALQS